MRSARDLLQRFGHGGARVGGNGVDRRVIHHDDSDVTVALKFDDGTHLMSVSLPNSRSS